MNQQNRLEQNPLQVEDPQNNAFNDQDKMKAGQTKKKGFKIKKNKHISLKKLNSIDIFNNPLYAGLQNQERMDLHEHNFGPWIHQDMLKQQSLRRQKIPQTNIQNIITSNNYQNIQRSSSSNEIYLEIPIRSAILQQSDNTLISYLPQIQIKPKREIHQLRTSSLDFKIQNKQIRKQSIPHLSPPKFLKQKYTLLGRNKSQSNIANLLKYESLKQIPSTQKILSKNYNSKPSKVIYNYCYSNNENNMVLNYFKDSNLFFKDTNYYNQNSRELFSSFKTQKDDLFLKKLINNKDNHRITIKNDKNQYIQPLRKSISKQLYEDLIKKKKKCR